MATKTEERRCGGCRSFVSDCECDYERCEKCDRHMDVCDCDDVDHLVGAMAPDWDESDVMRVARREKCSDATVAKAMEILTERRRDALERRELAEYNASHMPGKI